MLIIDENADKELVQSLRYYQQQPGEMIGIHFQFDRTKARASDFYPRVMQLVDEELKDENATIYLCGDGEVLIVGSAFLPRCANKLAYRISESLDLMPAEYNYRLLDLRDNAGKLLLHYEERIAREQQRLRLERQQIHAKAEAVRRLHKRREILEIEVPKDFAERANSERAAREILEVMLIEDDAFSRRLVEALLGKQHHVTALESVDIALASYIHIMPNIVFLDINLPDVTGHELLHHILRFDPHAYVVMLSSHTDRENVTEALKHGAKGFVAKPFTPDKLNQYVKRCHPFTA